MSPSLRLGGFSNPRRTEKENPSPLVLNGSCMNLDDLPSQGMNVKEIGQRHRIQRLVTLENMKLSILLVSSHHHAIALQHVGHLWQMQKREISIHGGKGFLSNRESRCLSKSRTLK